MALSGGTEETFEPTGLYKLVSKGPRANEYLPFILHWSYYLVCLIKTTVFTQYEISFVPGFSYPLMALWSFPVRWLEMCEMQLPLLLSGSSSENSQ